MGASKVLFEQGTIQLSLQNPDPPWKFQAAAATGHPLNFSPQPSVSANVARKACPVFEREKLFPLLRVGFAQRRELRMVRLELDDRFRFRITQPENEVFVDRSTDIG